MAAGAWTQAGYDIRFDWGAAGAAHAAARGILGVVDGLSFTTAVGVAVERGTIVHPAPARDAAAARLAEAVGGLLAADRREATESHPWSLSPAALRAAAAPSHLVLPSPNGSAIAAAAAAAPAPAAAPTVVAGSLRNGRALGAWLRERQGPVTVIAAGERWPDGSLRPALEDLLGAGAVIAALGGSGESPEATAARVVFEATRSVADAVRRCASGVELIEAGFGDDVEVAVEAAASEIVPVLVDGAFRAA